MAKIPPCGHHGTLNSGASFFEDAVRKAVAADVADPGKPIIADKGMQRYKCSPKDRSKSCGYIAHSDGVPNISFYDWRNGNGKEPVFTVKGEIPNGMDAARIAEEAEANKAKREAEDAGRHTKAATDAKNIWFKSTEATPDHPYLKAKGIKPHGIRQSGDELVIPIWHNGTLTGLQFIDADGGKRYLAGTRRHYSIIGDVEHADTVCIAEGFATAATIYEATGIPCAVAFDAGNLPPAAKALKLSLSGVKFIVCADDDWKRVNKQTGKPENIGLIKAKEAALAIGARLAVPDFGEHRGEKDTDFNDLHRLDRSRSSVLEGYWAVINCIERAAYVETPKKESGKAADCVSAVTPAETAESAENHSQTPTAAGTEEVLKVSAPLLKGAESSAHEPLFGSVARTPYPLSDFPAVLREAVEEVQHWNRTPMEMAATSALSALSACAQHIADIERDETLVGPISLWTMALAVSGERKSRLDKLFGAPMEVYQIRKAEELKPLIDQRQREIDAWKSQYDGLNDAIRRCANKGSSADKFLEQLNKMPAQPEPVRVPVILRGDDTTESLCYDLRFVWPSSAVVESEAGAVFGSHAMKADNIMGGLAVKNKLWEGGSHSIGRKTSKSFTVRGARFTYGLQIQPDVIREFQEKNGGLARGIGYWARFLITEPESTQGTRLYREPPKNTPRLKKLHKRLFELLETEPEIAEHGGLEPQRLKFSADGKRAWIEAHDAIEVKLGRGGDLYDIKDVASKAADNIARIAALFHILEHGPDGAVSAKNVQRAAAIIDYHLNEAVRFFEEMNSSQEDRDAEKIEKWLVAETRKRGVIAISRSDVYRHGFNNRNRERFEAAIKMLRDEEVILDTKHGAKKTIVLREC